MLVGKLPSKTPGTLGLIAESWKDAPSAETDEILLYVSVEKPGFWYLTTVPVLTLKNFPGQVTVDIPLVL